MKCDGCSRFSTRLGGHTNVPARQAAKSMPTMRRHELFYGGFVSSYVRHDINVKEQVVVGIMRT